MRLGTLENLQKAIGFDPGVQEAELKSAIDAATQNLIGLLRTELDRAAVTDTFYVLPSGSLPIGSEWRTRLALSRGFVDGIATVTYGSLVTDILTPVDLTTIVVDQEKGGVVITGPDLRSQYVKVDYTAGFDADDDDPEAYAGLPSWLDEVATMAAIAALDTMSPGVRGLDNAEDAARGVQRQIMQRIGSKIRYFPSATHPLG